MATSRVGAQVLPVPSGLADKAIRDPAVQGLLDFLAFWIVADFGAKGIEQAPDEVGDVLPAANRFPYEPAGNWVRNPTPALYLWWPRRSTSKITQYSTVYDLRERELRLFYAHREVHTPLASEVYSGMPQAIDAILARASARQRHPSYGYAATSSAPGTPIAQSLAPLNVFGWRYEGGQCDFAVPVPGGDPQREHAATNNGDAQRGFPVLFGTLRVWELVTSDEPQDPADVLGDALMSITTDGAPMHEGYLVAPDGSAEAAED